MTARLFRSSLLFATAFLPISFLVPPAHATTTCPPDPAGAVAEAREALEAKDTSKDRAALACLVEAVGEISTKLDDLIAGKITFTAPITAKGGFINQTEPPSTKEAD